MRKQDGFSRAVILALIVFLAPQYVLAQTSSDRKVTTRIAPVYPALARRMHTHGVVRLEVVVRTNGTVKSTKVLGGNPVLAEAATEAVEKWRFEPLQNETTEVVQLTFEPQ